MTWHDIFDLHVLFARRDPCPPCVASLQFGRVLIGSDRPSLSVEMGVWVSKAGKTSRYSCVRCPRIRCMWRCAPFLQYAILSILSYPMIWYDMICILERTENRFHFDYVQYLHVTGPQLCSTAATCYRRLIGMKSEPPRLCRIRI